MDVFLLGAGRPARGYKPSALKNIALNTRSMDWQIHSFESVADISDIHYLGGYHVDTVIENYPQLNFTVIADWESKGILHTFLKAPFSNRPAFAAYSDTIFRQNIVEQVIAVDADVVFCIDSHWKERYESRSTDDIQTAETIKIAGADKLDREVEFTGLVYFKPTVVSHLTSLNDSDVGSDLIHLINYLDNNGFSVKPFDVFGDWAELNSPSDIARFILGTKADTLARLEPLVSYSHIGKQVSFTSTRWRKDSNSVLDEISAFFPKANLAVRSSSKGEDNWHSSNAGGYKSLLNVNGKDRSAVSEAIETVVASYGSTKSDKDQILIQEFLGKIRASGVVFTCGLESGAPYYRFNFDDKTQSTDSVTSGTQGNLRTVIVSRFATQHLNTVEPELVPVLLAIQELEQFLGFDKLDVEFAIDDKGLVHIFQIRPITVDHSDYEVDMDSIENSLNDSILRFKTQQAPSPFVYGDRTLFANMPDWNPAEIIGTRPKPLAFSLYRYLITNDIWAQQRAEFGYRDVRPYPLILSFSGQPYVDARASFNSFIPAALPKESAERIVNAYQHLLSNNPQYHDKIEFDVAFTIWTPGFSETATKRLIPYGVTPSDLLLLESALKEITCKALTRLDSDIQTIALLNQRRAEILSSKLATVDKVFSLLDDCKRFGTLAFSHAARAGFIATTLLRSFVTTGILTEKRRMEFLKNIRTVAGDFEQDKHKRVTGKLSLEALIKKYGHLRPGTYEISTQAYWEDPERYIVPDIKHKLESKLTSNFEFSSQEAIKLEQVLAEISSNISVNEFSEYLIKAIQFRESVKFEFTKNLGCALDLCVTFGEELGFDREELSYIDYYDLEHYKLNSISKKELGKRIKRGRENYLVTTLIELPSLICKETDFHCFERLSTQPNFITVNKIEATIQQLKNNKQAHLANMIVLIPQADPGYDWLFGHSIAGLITQYGGANSHMAIRAAEIDLPAAIGVGEKLYEKIANMRRVELDCANMTIREVP